MALPRGKIKPTREIESIRSITREDLPRLLGPRDRATSMPKRLRDSHHTVARLLAMGHPQKLVADMTGYSFNRIHTLASAPAMIELVNHYRGKLDDIWEENYDAFAKLAVRNMIAAERQISDKLSEADDEGETLPIRELVSISRDGADRFGYGKKQTNINFNADFASMLERAIARSGKQVTDSPSRLTLVPSEPVPVPPIDEGPSHSSHLASGPTPSSTLAQPSFRRRA